MSRYHSFLNAIAPSHSPHAAFAVYWQIFFQSATFGKYENTEKRNFLNSVVVA